jgi:hypothetical protein
VRSDVSGVRKADAQFFTLGWARCGSQKKDAGTHHAKIVCFASGVICGSCSAVCASRRVKRQCSIFHARVGRCWSHKKHARTCHNELVFLHPVQVVGHLVRSGASGVRNVNTIPQKSASGHVTLNLCFCIRCVLRVMQSVLVCPAREMSTHNFLCSGGPGVDPTKSVPGHVMPNLWFCI